MDYKDLKDYKEDKELMKIVNYIKEINEQFFNPNEGIRDLLTRIQNDYNVESNIIEKASVNWDLSKITWVENIDINVLYSKLPVYKDFFNLELAKKCTKELYDEIIKKENLN